jgi:hypothetical protein
LYIHKTSNPPSPSFFATLWRGRRIDTNHESDWENHGFETRSAPASFAATLRGFTFCIAAPSSSAHG